MTTPPIAIAPQIAPTDRSNELPAASAEGTPFLDHLAPLVASSDKRQVPIADSGDAAGESEDPETLDTASKKDAAAVLLASVAVAMLVPGAVPPPSTPTGGARGTGTAPASDLAIEPTARAGGAAPADAVASRSLVPTPASSRQVATVNAAPDDMAGSRGAPIAVFPSGDYLTGALNASAVSLPRPPRRGESPLPLGERAPPGTRSRVAWAGQGEGVPAAPTERSAPTSWTHAAAVGETSSSAPATSGKGAVLTGAVPAGGSGAGGAAAASFVPGAANTVPLAAPGTKSEAAPRSDGSAEPAPSAVPAEPAQGSAVDAAQLASTPALGSVVPVGAALRVPQLSMPLDRSRARRASTADLAAAITMSGAAPNSPPAGLETAAVDTPTPPGAAPRVQPGEIIQQIAAHLRTLGPEHASEVRLQLEPQGLGQVTLHVRAVDGRLTVRLAAANPDVREAIAVSLPDLRVALAGAYSGAGQVDVTLGGWGGAGGGDRPSDRRPPNRIVPTSPKPADIADDARVNYVI